MKFMVSCIARSLSVDTAEQVAVVAEGFAAVVHAGVSLPRGVARSPAPYYLFIWRQVHQSVF